MGMRIVQYLLGLAIASHGLGQNLRITTGALPQGAAGTPYSQTFTASGGSPPYSWFVVAGALPPGLTLSSAGVLAGTPPLAGGWSFLVRVYDSLASSTAQPFNLTIALPSPNFTNALRVAQVADGASWKTLFSVVNLSLSPVSFTFQFWDDDGNPLQLPVVNGVAGTLSRTLPYGGVAFAETPGLSPTLLQGWAEVASSGPVGVTTIFRQSISGRPDSEGTVTGMLSGDQIFLPFDNTQGYVTGVALANTNPEQPRTISMLLRFDSGGQAAGALALQKHAHTAFVVPTMFPAAAGMRGSIQFTAGSADIAVVGLRFSPTNSFTSLGAFLGAFQ